MKPIHKVCSKDDLRPALGYIQIKNGFAWATDGHCAVKIPLDSLFYPSGTILPEDELYISGKLWDLCKFSTAKHILREGNTFTSDKGLSLKALTLEEFTQQVGRFPDIPSVMPEENKLLTLVDSISFNLDIMSRACGIFDKSAKLAFYFYGRSKAIIVRTVNESVKETGFALVMPQFMDNMDVSHPFLTDDELEAIQNPVAVTEPEPAMAD